MASTERIRRRELRVAPPAARSARRSSTSSAVAGITRADPLVLVQVLEDILQAATRDFEGDVPPLDIGSLIRSHNWPDPGAARWLADNLEEIYRAVNPTKVTVD
jgi:hypothetical protein